jgi:hypothetical protein
MARKKKKSPARAKPAKKRRVAVKRKTAKPARGKKVAAKSTAKRGKVKARKAKPAPRKSKPAKKKDVIGEGNYTASRNFREQETAFVQRNKRRIPKLGKEAEQALEGPEGKDLMAAEAEARGHSHAPEN